MTADPGTTFGGRYRVDRRLASGGMAIVYEGTDTLLRRRVAIKVLRDQYAADADFVRRFEYEAQAAARLSHPNIVAVYDFGRIDDATFIVMELVEGPTLAELIGGDRRLPESVAIDYAVQIAGGLAYAHRSGLLHRDIKPANILVTHDDVVKLSDFGIARAVSEHTLGVTQPGMVMGSVAYISPEQAQGRELDERADLYSVGVVLYQMITGTLPFSGDSPVAVALKHVSEAAPRIDPIAAGVSPALTGIVARLLEKDPARRFASANDLATALREARERPAVTPGGQTFADAPTMRIPTVTAPLQPPPRRSASPDRAPVSYPSLDDEPAVTTAPSNRARIIAIMVALGLLAALAGYAALHTPIFTPQRTIALRSLVGDSSTQASQSLIALGLRPVTHEEPSADVPVDRIVRQTPAVGTLLAKGDPVDLYVSSGPPLTDVPDVKGYTADDAVRDLQNAHFKTQITRKYSDQKEGIVIALSPNGGGRARVGSVVTLVVSQGQKPIAIPSLVTLTLDDARAAVRKLGLSLTVAQNVPSDNIPANVITSQDPAAGASAKAGDAIAVTVSSGAPAAAVPDVTGKTPDDASSTLSSAGFKVALTYNEEPANAPGTVTSQDPAAGASLPRGSKVKIVVNVPGTVPDTGGMTLDDAKKAISSAGYAIGNVAISPDGEAGKVVRTEPEANTNLRPGESVVIYYHPEQK